MSNLPFTKEQVIEAFARHPEPLTNDHHARRPFRLESPLR